MFTQNSAAVPAISRRTVAGTPAASIPGGISTPGCTRDIAASIARRPMRAPSSTTQPLPTSASSSSTAPWTMHRCATVARGPISVVTPGFVWMTVPSCTFARSRTTIGPSSPRSTAPYQTDAPDSIVTSPMSVAVAAMNASSATTGRLPSYSKSGIALVFRTNNPPPKEPLVTAAARPSEAVPSVRVAAGTSALDALREAGVELTGTHGAVVVRDPAGALKDLDWVPDTDVDVQPVAAASPDGLAVMRHSAAHAMAQAVQDLFPGTLLGIGPPIEDGFYYDFLPERPFTPEDLAAIEKRMGEIIKAGQRFSRRPIDDADARKELAHERFKLELIGLKSTASAEEATEVGAGGLTMYDNLDAKSGERIWTDLCRGPHLPTTRRIPAVKLMRSAAAYWRGSEKNPQLQRIYGTAWASRDDLKAYLQRLDEAAKRDHRKLGAELDLFSFPDELGSGLPVFHPKGGVLKRELEDYARQRHIDEGFLYVGTPHITKEGLFHTSGHLPYYADTMFPPMDTDAGRMYLKAMNCPMHNLIYKSRGRSYRDLPLRLFEFGSVYRYEKSGVVHGLTRVRGLEMDDSHSYVTAEQASDEIKHLLNFLLSLLRHSSLGYC